MNEFSESTLDVKVDEMRYDNAYSNRKLQPVAVKILHPGIKEQLRYVTCRCNEEYRLIVFNHCTIFIYIYCKMQKRSFNNERNFQIRHVYRTSTAVAQSYRLHRSIFPDDGKSSDLLQ